MRWETVSRERCEEGRRGGRLEDENYRQRKRLSDETVEKLRTAPGHP